jgi:hypothetical protein
MIGMHAHLRVAQLAADVAGMLAPRSPIAQQEPAEAGTLR